MNKEFSRRGGAFTFEELEAEALGQPAAKAGADKNAPKEVVKPDDAKVGETPAVKTGK